MRLQDLFEDKQPKDFFHELTKFCRLLGGYPQEYGFHHHSDKDEYHGTFVTREGRGKVHKEDKGNGIATYTCCYDEDNLLDKSSQHEQVLDAVKTSAPNRWSYVSWDDWKESKEPCYTVKNGTAKGEVVIHVKHDTQ